MSLPQFRPSENSTGGSQLGNSYLSLWARCPRKWYYEHYRPTSVGRGLAPLHTSQELLLGTLFHEGLAAWYESGFRDGEDAGEYSLDAAQARVDEYAMEQNLEHASPADSVSTKIAVERMLSVYHNIYGPTGTLRDWPDLRIAADHEGNPLIERDFEFELKPGYWYTGRIDAVCLHDGLLKVFEHKTASVRSAGGRLRTLGMDSQFTGEQWLLEQALPNLAISGVLVNVVLKDWGGPTTKAGRPAAFSSIATRETTIRTSAQIEQWRLDAISIIDQINSAVDGFEWHLKEGKPLEWAEAAHFPVRGTRNGQCHAYNRECEFIDLCRAPTMHERVVRQFKAKETNNG